MKLEDQVVSLELAKTLKELGVEQESLFYWMQLELSEGNYVAYGSQEFDLKRTVASAFTVAELGEMLLARKQHFFPYFSDQAEAMCWVYTFSDGYVVTDANEADARAKMLIYLLQNNFMTYGKMESKQV